MIILFFEVCAVLAGLLILLPVALAVALTVVGSVLHFASVVITGEGLER